MGIHWGKFYVLYFSSLYILQNVHLVGKTFFIKRKHFVRRNAVWIASVFSRYSYFFIFRTYRVEFYTIKNPDNSQNLKFIFIALHNNRTTGFLIDVFREGCKYVFQVHADVIVAFYLCRNFSCPSCGIGVILGKGSKS